MPAPPTHKRDLDGTIVKGALVNALGTIGKLLFPIYFIMVTRLYGPAAMGVFYISYVILEVIGHLTAGGLNDGVVMFGSRYATDEDNPEPLYRVLANGFAITAVLAVAIVIAGQVFGPSILRDRYGEHDLVPTFHIMLLALPLTVFATMVVAATKSLLLMHWEALITNFLRPVALLGFSLAYYVAGEHSVTALAWSYLWASILASVVALFALVRYFSYKKLLRHLFGFRLSWPLVKFAIPQNLNVTFNHLITNVDVMMLGYFNIAPQLIAFYGMGAQIVNNIRQIQLAFSVVFAAVIPRLHMAKDIAGISERLSMVSRWAISLALPTGGALIFFRQELVQIFHGSFSGDTTFMVLLAIRPILNCGFGMAGNVIVMTGHGLVTLFNSVVVASMNTVLNYVFIPKYGLTGAAMATMIASLTVTAVQIVEVRLLLGVRVIFAKLYKPLVAAVPGILAVIWLSSPDISLLERLGWCLGAIAVYMALLFALRLEPRDREIIGRFFTRTSARDGDATAAQERQKQRR